MGLKLADSIDQQRDDGHQYQNRKKHPPDRTPAVAVGMFAMASLGHVCKKCVFHFESTISCVKKEEDR